MNSLTVSHDLEKSPSRAKHLTKLKSQPEIRNPEGYFKTRRQGKSTEVESASSRGFHVELRPAASASPVMLTEMYAETSITKMKRTARALAALKAADEENIVTSDKLPSVAAPLRLSRGTGNNLEALKPRRALVSAPKTRMLPCSDPNVLLSLISSMQQKRASELAKRQSEQLKASEMAITRANRKNPFKPSQASISELSRVSGNAIRFAAKRLSEFFDRLALA